MSEQAAILIVNGGQDPLPHRWLALCLAQIAAHTQWPSLRIYVWNNNVDDDAIPPLVARYPNAVLVQANPAEALAHPHAVPLQRLYEMARDSAEFIITLDSDAFPVRDGWLTVLIDAARQHSLAGVWRDELATVIPPYVHASCLCARVDFIEQEKLRLDFFDIDRQSERKYDTLAILTERAHQRGLTPFKLRRSNRQAIHRLMGGVYGDLIYHHGAGSRIGVGFWDEARTPTQKKINKRVRDLAAQLLFEHGDAYLAWLRGSATAAADDPFVFVLGMHRSGTSCLAGCLDRCGVDLGDVSRANRYNAKGNHERQSVIALNDAILADNSGSWQAPPREVVVSAENRTAIADIVADYPSDQPSGVKDPRILLLPEPWLAAAGQRATLVGTFRHPAAVAQSLHSRDQMPTAEAYALWRRYNEALLTLHERHAFPIVAFDLRDVAAYKRTILELAFALNLQPDLQAINRFVTAALDSSRLDNVTLPPDSEALLARLRAAAYQPRYRLMDEGVDSAEFADLVLTIWYLQATMPLPTANDKPKASASAPPRPVQRPPLWRRAKRRVKRLLRTLVADS